MEEFAPGIPKSRAIEPLPKVTKPEQWTLAVQRHFADKAGEHLDLRLVDPASKAHSWALPKAKLPGPGDKPVLAVPQPTHTKEYALTAGVGKKPYVIESGYGKGTVRMDFQSEVEVTHSDPDHPIAARFNLYTGKGPQEFAIVRTPGKGQLLVNKTKTRESMPHMPWGSEHKPKMKHLEPEHVDLHDSSEAMMPKYDGAHTLIDFGKVGSVPRIFSYRVPKLATAGVIEHTHKVPQLMERQVPKELEGTVVRAELVGVTSSGKAIPATTLGGILNATVPRSREAQKAHGAHLMPVVFDVVRHKGKLVAGEPFSARYELVKQVAAQMGLPAAEVARTAVEKAQMLEQIRAGEHPLTNEGVILKPWGQAGVPTKVKFRPDHDVYVREVFPAVSKDGKELDRAGGFRYSLEPDGPIVGAVGTGFDHATARDMLKRPHVYKGRVAKVEAEKQFESGALSKPSFIEWHIDKGDLEKTSHDLQTLRAFAREVRRSSTRLARSG
jgi:hypothetical protein